MMIKSLPPTSNMFPAAASIAREEMRQAARTSWLWEPVPLFYAATLFASAFLLFWVEPLIAKMLLPRLGGTPAVWNTALMFFQVVLLAGYLYAHILTGRASPAMQVRVHGAVIVMAFAFLPLGIGTGAPEGDGAPVAWLIQRLAFSVGVPFFALSATAPVLQAWFARSSNRHAQDPYFLYAASNLGSLMALLGFPLLLEPWLTVFAQSRLWMLFFLAFAALLMGCAVWSLQGSPGRRTVSAVPESASRAAQPAWQDRFIWIALAFVPSSLLLGVTSFIATDVASAPLLWIVPLALYLLSFVITFARSPIIPMSWSLLGQAAAVALVLLLLPLPRPSLAWVVAANFAAFFLTALVCHGVLAARRPAASRLTEFYICLSVGGALGGIANALIAPVVFPDTYEYPLALLCACLLRWWATASNRPSLNWRDIVAPIGLLAIVLAMLASWNWLGRTTPVLQIAGLVLLPFSVFFFRGHAVRFALAVAFVMVPFMVARGTPGLLHQERSFFGVYRVRLDPNAPVIDLIDGTVLHGTEAVDPAHWRDELSYYHHAGPIGRFFPALRGVAGPQRVGVIGLGTGALACYAQAGDDWTFYEIDPAVLRLARDARYFHYLALCGSKDRVVLGDARISLAREPRARYDLLILDAFSSDAIPMHLVTREALQLYLAKLGPHGRILLHISNDHLKLWPMLDSLARELGLETRHQFFTPGPADANPKASEWLALARSDADLAFLDRGAPGWKNEHPQKNVPGWSDGFSNILSVMHW